MEERHREHYFVLIRITLLLILEGYIILSQSILTGASVEVLLVLALFIGLVSGKELVKYRYRVIFLLIAGVLWLVVMCRMSTAFTLLGVYLGYEVLTQYKPRIAWYVLPLGLAIEQANKTVIIL